MLISSLEVYGRFVQRVKFVYVYNIFKKKSIQRITLKFTSLNIPQKPISTFSSIKTKLDIYVISPMDNDAQYLK